MRSSHLLASDFWGNGWYWTAGTLVGMVALAVTLSYFLGLNRRLQRLTQSMKAQLADRKRVDEALEASEAFYHSLVEHLPLNIIRKDVEGRFTFANPHFCLEMKTTLEQLGL
jgi:PAS domain-containing protein